MRTLNNEHCVVCASIGSTGSTEHLIMSTGYKSDSAVTPQNAAVHSDHPKFAKWRLSFSERSSSSQP